MAKVIYESKIIRKKAVKMLKINIFCDNIKKIVMEPATDSVGFLVNIGVEDGNKYMINNRTNSFYEVTFSNSMNISDVSMEAIQSPNTFINYDFDDSANQSKTNMFDVSNYILTMVEYIRHLMRDPNMFDLDCEATRRFCFNSTKLQKIIIISLLEYFTKQFLKCNLFEKKYDDNAIDKFIETINPIEDFECLINRKCGFSIKYDFLKFGRTSPYIKLLNGDKKESLQNMLSRSKSLQDLENELINFESVMSQYDIITYSKISKEFKKVIIDVLIKFVLYSPYELGRVLNCIKGDKIPSITDDNQETQYISLQLAFLESLNMIKENFNDTGEYSDFALLLENQKIETEDDVED